MKKLISIITILAFLFGLAICDISSAAKHKSYNKKASKKKAKAPNAKEKKPTIKPLTKTVSKEASVSIFKDIKLKNSSYPYVYQMVNDYKVVSAYPDGSFKPAKPVTRSEFSKIIINLISYIEKRYDISFMVDPTAGDIKLKDLPTGNWAYPYANALIGKYRLTSAYPNKTFKPGKVVSRYEMASVMSKTMRVILLKVNMMPIISTKIKFPDVRPNHWAKKSIDTLLTYGILSKAPKFAGDKPATRLAVTVSGDKLINSIVQSISILTPSQLQAARDKISLPKKQAQEEQQLPAQSPIRQQLDINRQKIYLSGYYGGVYEKNARTNNLLGFAGSASYANTYDVFGLKGDYELTGKYAFNQVFYYVQGGGVTGALVNESRYDIDANTITPFVDFYGLKGQLLLGLKYANFSNNLSPYSIYGLNAGIATTFKLFDRNVLGRAFYTLIPSIPKTTSIFGAPSTMIGYELGMDLNLFDQPLLAGYSGETIFYGTSSVRNYNTVFLRYFFK